MAGPGWDGARVLKVHAALLLALPPGLGVLSLGGVGHPATLVGLGCLAWWALHHVARPVGTRRSTQPVRFAFLVFAGAVATSYVAATLRPIEGAEYSTLTLGVLLVMAWGGVLLVANDGIPDAARLLALTRVLVMLGAAMASLGIVQFLTGQVLVDRLSIPGLSANHSVFGLTQRQGFTRPAGTASHPIEYGAVLTMILPIALALGISDSSRSALRRWTPVALIVACVPLSISRSALLSGALGILVMMSSWPGRARRIGLAVLVTSTVGTLLFVPGMLGSLLGLFTTVGGDNSAVSRVASYAIAGEFIGRAPIFGRGFSTFLPSYRILDNQYLGLLIETGIVGLVAFLVLIGAGVCAARAAERSATDVTQRQLARGLGAAVLSGALTMALFDGLSFSMAASTLFLVIGLAGAARRIHSAQAVPASVGPATTDVARIARKRWKVGLVGAVFTGAALFFVYSYPGVYTTQTAVVFLSPATDAHPNNLESTSDDVIAAAGLVERLVNQGVETSATTSVVTLAGRGVREGSSVELPNSGGQWAVNYAQPQLLVQVTGPTEQQVTRNVGALIAEVQSTAAEIQRAAGVRSRWLITTRPNPDQPVVRYGRGYRRHALLVTLVLGGLLTLAASVHYHNWVCRRETNRQRPDENATLDLLEY